MCSNIKINQLKFVIDMKTMKLFKLAFDIYMIVSKKPIGLIVLLFIPCFAVCQNSVDSTTVIQDCIATITDSLSQRNAQCKCDTVRKDSCLQQHGLSLISKDQKMTRDINPNALKMRKFDPFKKKFNDMQLIKIIGPHIRR